MADTAEQAKGALLDAAIALADRRGWIADTPVDEAVLAFYFDRVAPQDFVGKNPIDLCSATVRHVQMAERRRQSESLVRVYNPSTAEDGWTSSHTAIDIVLDDMQFIVDSVLAVLETRGLRVHVLVHPILAVTRSADGLIESLAPSPSANGSPVGPIKLESFLHLEVDRLSAGKECNDLADSLQNVLLDVQAAVADWHAMRERAAILASELDGWATEAAAGRPRTSPTIGTDPAEVAELLRWMEAGWFIFMGYREYDFVDDPANPTVVSRPKTGLGTLRQSTPTTRGLDDLPPDVAELARRPTVVTLTRTNTLSTVHRAVPLDYVGIKEIDRNGRVTGERRFLGLFTSAVFSDRVEDIPVVRAKVAAVMERADFRNTSHDHARLLNTLQVFPRAELFQVEAQELETMALDILDLRDRRQVSLLVRRDAFDRFLSCLVFVPRERYNTDVRIKIENTLMDAFHGTSSRYSTEVSDAPLARIHLVIYTDPTHRDGMADLEAVRARLSQVTRTWDDYLYESLARHYGEDVGRALLGRYGLAFDPSYRDNVLAELAVSDIGRLEALGPEDLDISLHRPLDASANELRCKLYRSGSPITLSRIIPVLHDLGATVTDERPYEIALPDGKQRYIYDLGMRLTTELDIDARARFRDAVLAVWQGEAESDGLAELVVTAALTWREVAVLRAYSRYLVQIGPRFSRRYVIETLCRNPEIVCLLNRLFHIRLDPNEHEVDQGVLCRAEILESISAVASLDADRILRSIMAVLDATVRTNYWQVDDDGRHRDALAFKLDPSEIPDLPKPVPLAEIFVYCPRTEGVHLRSGRVARGGLRWSDRMEDYRTEILGLMKAQTVKNAVIVPSGAKGGFVARHLPANGTRDEVMAEVVRCYKIFVGSLLDLTDNVIDDRPVPPPLVTRLDGDDPYLVVAADKGTSTFSDVANSIATERGFWLDDAFASGGSAGYDHKELGITARGAWISVERHFREIGLDAATTPFTAIGIGDMSGDVFGNGMLRSRHTKLIAAFDHRHVFVDPSPDLERSFAERQRLYDLPQSTWADYDASLISAGGGVFPRSAKSITVTPEMRAALDIKSDSDHLTPVELMHAVLQAPVDLLWNGGIGTYVKATTEQPSEIGDRANDNIRVDASDLQCRVVAEGGNLGVTQAARIEFAQLGGRINTDAIDNSAGVDCSDHEVNLKILLALAERNGDLTRKQRNEFLESMAQEVSAQVLDNNDSQNETLSTALYQAPGMAQVHDRLMDWLEDGAGLDRTMEGLPSSAELERRRVGGEGLTRPELAVLLAYTKNLLAEQIATGELPLDPRFDHALLDYFPSLIRAKFAELVPKHPLRSELLATIMANELIDRGGITMVHRLMEETSAGVVDIAKAHRAVWSIFDLGPVWAAVRSLDRGVPSAAQVALLLEVKRLGERATCWLLRNESQPIDISATIERFGPTVCALRDLAAKTDIGSEAAARIEQLVDDGIDRDLAAQVVALGPAFGFLDLSQAIERTEATAEEVADVYRVIDERLQLSVLRQRIIALPRDDYWQALARNALRDQIFAEHATLTAAVIGIGDSSQEDTSELVDQWFDANHVAVSRCRRTIETIEASEKIGLARASVAMRALAQLRSQHNPADPLR